MRSVTYIATVVTLVLLALASQAPAEVDKSNASENGGGGALLRPTLQQAAPNMIVCTHNYNNLLLPISNFGYLGSGSRGWPDCETGIGAPSGEFPAGSEISYLYAGALWIGAVVGEDTLVSVGFNGWAFQYEMIPCSDPIICNITKLSNRPGDPDYDTVARSDLEFFAIYSDTIIDPSRNGRDWGTGSGHIPLNIEITQHSYSWSAEYAQDFVLIDYGIKNVGQERLENLYLGLYVDGDVAHISGGSAGYGDDMCGFRETVPSRAGYGYLDTINFAWIADNDGDQSDGAYDYMSPRSVAGVRVMRTPEENTKVTFNWWVSNGNSALDWGPMIEATRRNYGTGGQGTPEGDKNMYYILSNGEQDYDQTHSYVDFSDDGWLPPNPAVAAVALGGDTRYVISTGPFDIDAGDSLPMTLAYVAGEYLHKRPYNFVANMRENYDPDVFYDNLSFEDAGLNCVWASWVYDNPGFVTEGDGGSGPFWEIVDTVNGEEVIDTFYYAGDGVPDFRAATAPPSPVLRFTTSTGSVTLRWNGEFSETFIDPFTKVADFEGYSVYMGRLPHTNQLALLASHDFYNFKRYIWNEDAQEWTIYELPISLDLLHVLYGEAFDPFDYPRERDNVGFVDDDGVTFCFDEVGWNQSIPGWQDGAFVSGKTGFKKRFASEIEAGTVTPERDTLNPDLWVKDIDPLTGDSVLYHKFYEYEFNIDNLLPSVAWYFSVTAFDFGDFANSLEPLESSPIANVVEVWAINDASVSIENNEDVMVYPNPYVGDGTYWSASYEDTRRTGFIDHERRIHFINLPPSCTIKIFTLSGDLVKEIEHPGIDTDTDAKLQWNMRSTNNELVASGIYLFTVESQRGSQIGKIVIIL